MLHWFFCHSFGKLKRFLFLPCITIDWCNKTVDEMSESQTKSLTKDSHPSHGLAQRLGSQLCVSIRKHVTQTAQKDFFSLITLPFLGCQERGALNDTKYSASTEIQPAGFARLDTTNPGSSRRAWCADPRVVSNYVQIDLGMYGQ